MHTVELEARELQTQRKTPQRRPKAVRRRKSGGDSVRQPQILTTTSLKTGEKLPRLQLVWFLPA